MAGPVREKPYYPHAERNQFLAQIVTTPFDDGVRFKMVESLPYVDPWGKLIVVPAGFVTDFASIPPLATIAGWVQVGSVLLFLLFSRLGLTGSACAAFTVLVAAWVVVMLANGLEHEGTWDAAAVVHDFLYATRARTFTQSNWILLKAMTAKGGGHTVLWKRWVIYGGVAVGGWLAWQDDARKAKDRFGPLALAGAATPGVGVVSK